MNGPQCTLPVLRGLYGRTEGCEKGIRPSKMAKVEGGVGDATSKSKLAKVNGSVLNGKPEQPIAPGLVSFVLAAGKGGHLR